MSQSGLASGTFLKNRTYQIDRPLGQGGFGTVYVARDLIMGKACAIKESADQSPNAQTQFEIEARILSNLNHPHLVRVTDNFVEPPSGRMYLVMQFVEGRDLQEMLEDAGLLPEDKVLLWMDQVLAGVAYLHAHQPPICHRDIKPANIRVLPDGRTAKLVDFGIAKVGGKTKRTASAARGVTPGFSPMEQYGTRTDTYSDVYALGATYYVLLTGEVPPDAPDRFNAGASLTPPRQFNPSISLQTEAIVLRALDMDPQQRFQTADEMRQAFKATTVITCPNCGRQTSISARFCPGCQTPLAASTAPAGTLPMMGSAISNAAGAAVASAPVVVGAGAGSPAGPSQATGGSQAGGSSAFSFRDFVAPYPFPARRVLVGAAIGALVALVLTGMVVAMFPGGVLVGVAAGFGLIALVALGAVTGTLAALKVDVDSPHFLIVLALAGSLAYIVTIILAVVAAVMSGGSLAVIGVACFLGSVLGATGGMYLTTTPFFHRLTP